MHKVKVKPKTHSMLTYQVVEEISKNTGVSEEDVSKVIAGFAEVLREALTRRSDPVTVRNLGTFKFKQNKEDRDSRDLIFTSLLD